MRVRCDEPSHELIAEFRGQEVCKLVNYLLMWQNQAEVGEWVRILRPLCAPIIEGDSEEVVTSIEEEVTDETDTEEEMQAEAFRLLGGVEEDDDTPEKLIETEVVDYGKLMCANCWRPFYTHTPGSNRCILNSAPLTTAFSLTPTLGLLSEGEVEEKFAVTVGEEGEVICG